MKSSEIARLNEVRRIGKDRTIEAAATLDAAFQNDALFKWLRKDQDEQLQPWWEALIANLVPFAEVHGMGDLSAVSVWLPSEELTKQLTADSHFELDKKAIKATRKAIDRISYKYFGKGATFFDKAYELIPKKPLWYLACIGTHPEHIGKGKGTLLLQKMTQRLDEMGVPAYLEATTQKSAALYMRHGFKHTQEINLMGAPTMYGMHRSPQR